MPTIKVAHRMLSTGEAAQFLGRQPQTLTNWRNTDAVRIPYVKIGRRVVYRLADLEAFVAQNTVNPITETE